MIAILISLQDLYYAKKTNSTLRISLNNRLFTEELLNLLDSGRADLFVLVDRPSEPEHDYELLGANRIKVFAKKALINQLLENDLDDFLEDVPAIKWSHDLQSFSYNFSPKEQRWNNDQYHTRILFSFITPEPDVNVLSQFNVQSVRLLSSSILPYHRQTILQAIKTRKENLQGHKAIIILDNDDTMLSNFVSELLDRTCLNEEVLKVTKEVRSLLIEQGAEVTCYSMSAREKHRELDLARFGRVTSMDAIAEVVNKRWFPLKFDKEISFSYPLHNQPIKQTKIQHLFKLIMAGKINVENAVVVLFDDCSIELNSQMLKDAERQLQEALQCQLLVVPVTRYVMSPAETLSELLQNHVAPASPVVTRLAQQGLFAPSQATVSAEPVVDKLVDEFAEISLLP